MLQVAALAEAAGAEVDPQKPYAELWCANNLSRSTTEKALRVASTEAQASA